jgi:dipeptide/tripeptide permease
LSLEEGEVERLTGVRRETLASLVDHRLLRSDQRAESFYYELSHDSLVEPVLAKNRVSMTSFGLVQLVASLTMCITALIFFVVPTAKTVKPEERVLAFIFVLPFAISLGWLGIKGIRRSTTTLALFWQKSAGYRSPLVWAIAGYVGLILVIGVVYLPWNHDPIHYQLLEWAVVLVGVAATWKLLHMRSSAVPLFLTGFLMEIVVQVTKTMDTSLPHKELSVILLIWLFILIDSAIVYYVLRLRRMNLLK